MKHLFLLLGLLAGGSAAAQAPRVLVSPASPFPLAAAPAASDTAAAIHRLFTARRKRQGYATGATAILALGTLIALASNRPAHSAGSNGFAMIGSNDLDLFVDALVTLPLIPVVAIGFGGWGRKHEQQVLATWQQQHQLPRYLKRQLKARYFQELLLTAHH